MFRPSRYAFTLVLARHAQAASELENALHEAGCDDALLGMRNGVPCLGFEREAPTLTGAIHAAIEDVRRAGVTAIARVEPGP